MTKQSIEGQQVEVPTCLQGAKIGTLAAGTQIFSPGDVCENFYFLVSGSVRVDLVGRTGRSMTLYRFGAGESCILTTSGLLSGDPYNAEAFTESEVRACILPMAQFKSKLEGDADFRALVFAEFAHRLSHIMQKIDDLTSLPIASRLAELLLEYADENDHVMITHGQLGADLGTAREVISRKLARWQQRGWITRRRGQIHLADRNALQKIAGTTE